MSRRLVDRLRTRRHDERGVIAVLFALLLIVLLGLAAVLVDSSQARASRRDAQSISDLAALAGGKSLSNGAPYQACVDAITYLNSNARDMSPKITASSFCGGAAPNTIPTTRCATPGTQAKPTQTVGRYTVTVTYPVLDSDIVDSHYNGAIGANDGVPCERLGVKVLINNGTTFGKVLGTTSVSASRLAVVRAEKKGVKSTPSLWLLDPTGCDLTITGGSTVNVGTSTTKGLITVDSNAANCTSSNDFTINANNNSYIRALGGGSIDLFALPTSATTCSGHACEAGDVSGGNISPQPTSSGERATRAPVDWKYNCKATYPNFAGLGVAGCDDVATTPPYVDNLRTAITGTVAGVGTNPGGYQTWSPTRSCTGQPTGTFDGNWWVNCPSFKVGNGTTLTFNGNVVFDGNVDVQGVLNVNTSNTSTFPGTCLPSGGVVTPCKGESSSDAAFVWMRNGTYNSNAGGVTNFNHVTFFQQAGTFTGNGNATYNWTAPTVGPFKGLSLWSENQGTQAQYTLNGGGGLNLSGVFFTPSAAPFNLSGSGTLANPLAAQFISYRLNISGGGTLSLIPDPDNQVNQPAKAGVLIR
jgi:Flp pilus assembly protein TadG